MGSSITAKVGKSVILICLSNDSVLLNLESRVIQYSME